MYRSSLMLCLLFISVLSIRLSEIRAQPSVEFSHERGFYYNSIDLQIYAHPENCMIKYTLDGSDPATSSEAISAQGSAQVYIDPYSGIERALTPGYVVRACAISDMDTSKTVTHTYIFLSEIKFQLEVSPVLAPYWPGEHYVPNTFPEGLVNWMQSYAQEIFLKVDPAVVHRQEYFTIFEDAIRDIPVLSLVTDPEHLFHDSSGIYINAAWSGREWERPGSLELLNAGDEGFQVNTGIRIRGGVSARGDFPKHAFRLFFRGDYGDTKLRYPLFNDYGADEFDKIDLRSSQNNSWHLPGGNSNADFIRDLYSREIQGEMEQPYTRSEYYHLFLNGNYWGLYQTQERPEARYAVSYFGGSREDYDAVKSSGPSYDYPSYTLEATDGDLNSSYALWEIGMEGFNTENYNKARGLNPDGSVNPEYPVLLDEINLIDYIIIIYYIGNHDGPASLTPGDTRINNFFGIYNREKPDGFKYFIHDAEHVMRGVNDDITQMSVSAGSQFPEFNPMSLHLQLMQNEDYRQAFADRVWKHFFEGALTPARSVARYSRLADEMDQGIIGESARWGYVRPSRPYTKEDTWQPVVNYFINNYCVNRTGVVIDQFTTNGWMNGILPPEFDPSDFEEEHPGEYLIDEPDFSLTNPNSSGEIYYTLDGTDPRDAGGAVAAEAILYTGDIPVSGTALLATRIKDGDAWSPLRERVILTHPGIGLLISELSYFPIEQIIGDDTLRSKDLEFIEIKNTTDFTMDLSACILSGGVDFTFPMGVSLEPDSLIVVASDTASFNKLYGFEAFGPFSGSLSNEGESIILNNAAGRGITQVEYNDGETWHEGAHGTGYTLVYRHNSLNHSTNLRENWRVSTHWLGSPGKDDPAYSVPSVRITEVLANSEYPNSDAVELYNPEATDADISNWFLSDERDNPAKWQIPSGSVIPAGGYLVFFEGHYVGETLEYTNNEFGTAFSISSAGERLYLYSGDGSAFPQEYVCDYRVGATEVNTSFGDYHSVSGDTHRVQLEELTLGAANTGAKKSPVIFSSLMYHPFDDNYEFLVLKNRTDSVVDLFHTSDSAVSWEIGGIAFGFPSGESLDPGDSLYLVEKLIEAEAFRTGMDLDSEIRILNYPGKMKNSSEEIEIRCPVLVETDTTDGYAYMKLESIEYDDDTPWPVIADGDGYALKRLEDGDFANDPSNWGIYFDVLPVARAGLNRHVRLGTNAYLVGTESNDPENRTLSYEWQMIRKPEASISELTNSTSAVAEFVPDEEGEYLFSLQVDNGLRKSVHDYVSVWGNVNQYPVAGTYPTTYYAYVDESCRLTATGCYDPDYDELNYEWELDEVPSASAYSSDIYTGRSFDFIPDAEGTFKFVLTVNDGEYYSDPVNVRVRASVNALPDQNMLTNRTTIYPNPVKSELFIDFTLYEASDAEIVLTSLQGKTILIQRYEDLAPGRRQLHLMLGQNTIPQGVYVIRIDTKEFTDIRRLIHIR